MSDKDSWFYWYFSGNILYSNDSSNHWEIFKKDHINLFGKPRIVFTDQSKSEFGGVFDRGCVTNYGYKT